MNSAGAARIRRAIPEELEAIVALDRAIESLPHWAIADYITAMAAAVLLPLRCVFVAEVADRIEGLAVGMVQTIVGESWGELETIGVSARMQRQGLGRELCLGVVDWCRSHGAAHVDLEVRSRSAGPIALYRELGFEAVGSRRSYYKDPADDALLMRLDLNREQEQPAPATEGIR